ncbi:MAG: hypothetical protein ACK55Z_05580, partial [bacterium]
MMRRCSSLSNTFWLSCGAAGKFKKLEGEREPSCSDMRERETGLCKAASMLAWSSVRPMRSSPSW